jgi:hypothetical protein
MESKQGSTLSRRVVHLITQYLEPKEIFSLITKKEYDYSVLIQNKYGCRDRAMMATCFASAGRISEVVGGPRFQTERIEGKRIVKKVGKHPGLQAENLVVNENYITVSGMKVVKRSQKLLTKYGDQIATRDDFVIPLKRGLFSNVFWDQLVPFGWLILEYLTAHAPKRGKLFPYEDTRAYQIVREITGMFPHWFRAQAEQFYGHFLLTDSIKLAKFVKIQDVQHVKHYIGYDWKEQLKDTSLSLDFKWIEEAVLDIQKRMTTIAYPQECAEGPSLPSLRSTAHVNKASQVEEETPLEHVVNSEAAYNESRNAFPTATSKLGLGEASQSQACQFYSFSRGLVECSKDCKQEKDIIYRVPLEVCQKCWNDPRCPGRRQKR